MADREKDPTLASREPLPVVPAKYWGKDHWSTLAYVETRTVDYGGELGLDQMRNNPRRHREFVGPSQRKLARGGGTVWAESYASTLAADAPDRIADAVRELGHDDWDCLDDLIRHGFVEIVELDRGRPGHPFGDGAVAVRLTDGGYDLAAAVRRHKSEGGNFGSFELPDRFASLESELGSGDDAAETAGAAR